MNILQWVVVILFAAYMIYNIIPTIPTANFNAIDETMDEFYKWGSPYIDGPDRINPKRCAWSGGILHCK